jgi:pectate lyase
MIHRIKNTFILFLIPIFTAICQQLAFPGAEGAGKYTAGGRGGKIIEVTNLNDAGVGSLRAAIYTKGARIIVFRISGTIQLKSDLKIIYDSLTIAGQTAPGDGICLRDHQCVVEANQIIIRYIRFRLGDETLQDTDAFWGRNQRDIILDHCTMSWSVDEAGSFYGNQNFTMQWCLLSESLYMSVHPKGAHGYGGIWGGTNATFHHNLFAHHSSRNPRFAGGETNTCVNTDFRNNVIYNWGFNSAYGGEAGSINMVANYFKSGPATKSGVKNRIVEITEGTGKWFIDGNFVDGYPDITADNWSGGVQGTFAKTTTIRLSEPNPFTPISQHAPQDAYRLVLQNAGASLPKRDKVDTRIVNEVYSGKATYDGRFYEIQQSFTDTLTIRGIIDSQKDVGGWPELISTIAPLDSDHDGMPDDWEISKGLNPNDDQDRNNLNSEGYTRIEEYLNSIGTITKVPSTGMEPSEFNIYQNYPNPFNPSTMINFEISSQRKIQIIIFDILGRIVRTLTDSVYPNGSYSIEWDGRNDKNISVTTGVYFCRISDGYQNKTIKMNLLK